MKYLKFGTFKRIFDIVEKFILSKLSMNLLKTIALAYIKDFGSINSETLSTFFYDYFLIFSKSYLS